jgi:tetratricopeptide (TPR) repeat protein
MIASPCPLCGNALHDSSPCHVCGHVPPALDTPLLGLTPVDQTETALPSLPHQPPSRDTQSPLAPATQTPAIAPHATPALSPDNSPGVGLPCLPGYVIETRLGQGGMGIVYKARQLTPSRTVALKMIRAGADADTIDLARFRTEPEAIARLSHPNIVAVYEVGTCQGQPFFSFEFCPGGSLDRQLDGTPWQAKRAARLVQTLAGAVQAAHQAKVIHRDLKPANVLLMADGTPKVSDFGLAKQLDDHGQTQTGAIMGTPSYMAPEQAVGNKAVGPRTDVYALGAILYELLTGRPPFKAATPLDTVWQVVNVEPVPVRQLNRQAPRDLETVCLKCLHKDARRRYASADALADDLRLFLAGKPIRARPTSLAERALKWGRRRPAVAALLAVVVLVLVGLLVGGCLYTWQLQVQVALALTDQNRRQIEQLLGNARQADSEQQWQEARAMASQALTLAQRDPSLDDLQTEAEELQEKVEGHLQLAQARQQAAEKEKGFWEQYHKALFHAAHSPHLNLATRPEVTREAAQSALAHAGIRLEGGAKPALDPTFSREQQDRLLPAAYELLLILAEAVAGPGTTPSEERRQEPAHQALEVLSLAEQLRCPCHPTRAFSQRRADYLTRLGRQEEARREQEQAPSAPSGALDHFLLGEELYQKALLAEEQDQQRYLSQALREFQATLWKQADHFWAQYFLAVCRLQLWDPGSTKDHLLDAQHALTICLDQQREFLGGYLLRGYVNAQLGRLAEAEADFRKAEQLKPEDELTQYALYNHWGVVHVRQKQLDRAGDDFRRAIRLMPDRYHAYLNLAHVLQRQKQGGRALEQIEQALRVAPAECRVYRAWAALLQPQDPSAALAALDWAICLQASNGRSRELAGDHLQRGHLLHRAKRYAEAVAAYEDALQADADLAAADFFRGETLLQLARSAEGGDARRYYEEAALAFDRARQKGWTDPAVYRGAAHANAKLGHYARARDAYSYALSLKPTATDYAARGWLHLMGNAAKEAEDDFTEAIRLDPASADAYGGRANARIGQKRIPEAVADADRAVLLEEQKAGAVSAAGAVGLLGARLAQGPVLPAGVALPAKRDPRTLYKAARVFALAAEQVRGERTGQRSRETAREDFYLKRAEQLLQQALQQLPAEQRWQFVRANVAQDAAMNPFRGQLRLPGPR